ncbi:MAG: protein translocase subunit SecD [Clostridia bacterium]|nr:protein translocase subunit SecD [Clostridia bacterium]
MKKRIIGCTVLAVIMAFFIYVCFAGLTVGSFNIPPKLGLYTEDGGIRRGLDLDGGASITFEPVLDDEYDGDINADVSSVVEVMRKRLTNLGYTEGNVFRTGEMGITVEIPGISSPEDAIDVLGQTAELAFVTSDNEVVLTGKDIVSASAGYDSHDSSFMVIMKISPEAVERFSEATLRMSKMPINQNYIAIVLDETEIARPYVKNQINDTECVITTTSQEEAVEYAAVISAGALPFSLEAIEQRSIGPTLGDGALESSLIAALIGIIAVIILMVTLYRLPGVVSAVALVFYVSIVCLVCAVFRINLSLPGIAGVILSIGMAVDANVIIFERIKEELFAGKSTAGAVNAGFDKALLAIIDSNITTVIAAIVLMIFGKGTIQGFAVTLLIGVICSMLTAVFVTKYLLRSLVVFGVKNPVLYGLSRKKAELRRLASIRNGGTENE